MISAETLECTVPSANAVKDSVISCVTGATNLPDIWMALAAVVSAVATILLAIFAVRAWLNSKEQLKSMETQIADQRLANEESIKAARELAIHSRQTEHLATYCTALTEMCDAAIADEEDLDLTPYMSRCTNAWMVWGMELFRTDKEFRELVGRWNKYIRDDCQQLHLKHFMAQNHEERMETDNKLGLLVGQFIGNLQTWQVDQDRREEIRTRFLDIEVLELRGYNPANKLPATNGQN